MNPDHLILIGKITKPHGYRGVLQFIAKYDFAPSFLNIQAYFIKTENGLLPYIKESVEDAGNRKYLLKLEDVSSKESAEKLCKKEVFISKDFFDKSVIIAEDDQSYNFLIGYQLFDQDQNFIGKIEDVIELPTGEIAQLIINGKEVLLPIAPDLIIAIEHQEKNITIQIPEGLLDVYL